jgi:hypothetical protein
MPKDRINNERSPGDWHHKNTFARMPFLFRLLRGTLDMNTEPKSTHIAGVNLHDRLTNLWVKNNREEQKKVNKLRALRRKNR